MSNDLVPAPKRVVGRPFQKGEGGRKIGARAKLGEKFLEAICADFNIHGVAAIQLVREQDPVAYVKVIASILPKEITGEDGAPLLSGISVTFVRSEKS
jgi:hypothetical protein